MTQFEKAAIIGYWRSGANDLEIAGIMQIEVEEITKIIAEYKAPTDFHNFQNVKEK